jgi:hypothetical protein
MNLSVVSDQRESVAQHLRRRLHPVVRRHETPQVQGPRILGAGSIALGAYWPQCDRHQEA